MKSEIRERNDELKELRAKLEEANTLNASLTTRVEAVEDEMEKFRSRSGVERALLQRELDLVLTKFEPDVEKGHAQVMLAGNYCQITPKLLFNT